jgi:hypothetical protein
MGEEDVRTDGICKEDMCSFFIPFYGETVSGRIIECYECEALSEFKVPLMSWNARETLKSYRAELKHRWSLNETQFRRSWSFIRLSSDFAGASSDSVKSLMESHQTQFRLY